MCGFLIQMSGDVCLTLLSMTMLRDTERRPNIDERSISLHRSSFRHRSFLRRQLTFSKCYEPHWRFARLWIAWSHGSGITGSCGRPVFRRIGESGPKRQRGNDGEAALQRSQHCKQPSVQNSSSARWRETNLVGIIYRYNTNTGWAKK